MTRLNRSSSLTVAIAFAAGILLSTLALIGRAEEAVQTKKIMFDNLVFKTKKDEPFKREILGEKIEALDGKRVAIRGWMLPNFEQNVKSFVLIRDNQWNNFSDMPLCESVVVDLKPDRTTKFSINPVTVEGVLSIREFKLDGKTHAVYHIEANSVKAQAK